MNYTVNRLLERKEIFADFVNGTLFGGEELLHAGNLTLLSPNSGAIYRDEKGKKRAKEQRGDVHMQADEAHFSVIVVTEPQTSVDYTMVVRVMEYVAMKYKKQVEDLKKEISSKEIKLTGPERLSGIRKEDRLTPVVAIVFYCGTDMEWDGSRSLYDLLEWDEDLPEISMLRKYIPDFQLNIVQVQNIGETEIFKTSLQYIFGMLKYSKDKKRMLEFMNEHREALDRLDSVEAEALLALLGQPEMVEKQLEEGKETEAISVCLAIDEMIRDGEMRGLERGLEQGLEQGLERGREQGLVQGHEAGIASVNQLVQKLMGLGRMDDLVRSTTDAEYQKKLFKEFNIV